MASLSDLTTPQTADQIKAQLIAALQDLGFPVTDWFSGGVGRTLLELLAQGLALFSQLIAAIAAGGFVTQASGDWLTLVASDTYQLTRNAATFTAGNVVLT